MTIQNGWINKRAQLTPNKIALIDIATNRKWTYEQLIEQIKNWQCFFSLHRAQKGDRIAIIAENTIDFFAVLFACEANGLIFVPLNWRLNQAELQYVIDDCRPALLLYGEQYQDIAYQISRNSFPLTINNIVQQSLEHVYVTETDCWMMIYTGGTTGKPKGVMLSYDAVNCNAVNTVLSWGLSGTDTTVNYMPLFHTGGLNALAIPILLAGGTVVIGSKFNALKAMQALNDYAATIALFVPTMYQEMVKTEYFKQQSFSSMNVFLSGGAPCPVTIYEHFAKKGLHFKEGYGLTEAGPNNFFISPEIAMQKRGSVGKNMLLNDVKVVTENGQLARTNEVGELYVRGKHMFTQYWGNEAETAKTLVDGWLRTGDLARKDEEDDLYIVGRAKDMIISGGENIYPQEIESCIIQHPAVDQVAVVGVLDDYWGEVVTAFIVSHQQTVSEQEIESLCKAQLGKYKVPKKYIFVNELPMTTVGKIDKKALATMK